jgi:SpoIID/LytB domain protein
MINIVNDIDIESYVKSILTSQFPSPLEPEVISSLAILARTDAYFHALKNEESFWHVSAAETGYMGNALVVNHALIDRCVDKTKHLILVHPDGEKNMPFPTAWTEHSAGKTASYETMFRKESISSEKGVEAPHAAIGRKHSKWSYQISKKQLAQQLDIPSIKSIETFIDKESNKVYGEDS